MKHYEIISAIPGTLCSSAFLLAEWRNTLPGEFGHLFLTAAAIFALFWFITYVCLELGE